MKKIFFMFVLIFPLLGIAQKGVDLKLNESKKYAAFSKQGMSEYVEWSNDHEYNYQDLLQTRTTNEQFSIYLDRAAAFSTELDGKVDRDGDVLLVSYLDDFWLYRTSADRYVAAVKPVYHRAASYLLSFIYSDGTETLWQVDEGSVLEIKDPKAVKVIVRKVEINTAVPIGASRL